MLPRSSVYHEKVLREMDRIKDEVIRVSQAIHAHPELGLQERWACDFLVAEASARGFRIEKAPAGLETAFIAAYSSPKAGPKIAFLCEYDALPGLGHACGHNVIAAASFGAAMALKPIVDELGGSIHLIGTPDEEAISEASKGGKVVMSQAGLFDGLDAALMMHPWGGQNGVWGYAFPLKDFTVHFEGKPAHYTEPEKGINALEALLLFLNNVNALKRSWSPSVMLAYTITDGGGPSAVVVPKSAEAHFTLKAFNGEYQASRFEQVEACMKAVSALTGAAGSIRVLDEYRHMIPNLNLAASLSGHIRALGGSVTNPVDSQRSLERRTYPGISTDFSDVSWRLPAIHGYCSIGGEELVAHTPEFAAAAGSRPGNDAAVLAATSMALTAADMLADKAFALAVKEEFQSYKDHGFGNVPGIPPGYLPFPMDFLEAIAEAPRGDKGSA